MDLTIKIEGASQAEAEFRRIAAALDHPRPMFAEAGKHTEVAQRQHFRQRDAEGNANGWPSRHFFLRQGRDVTSVTAVSDQGATVTVASVEMRHKLDGGDVSPKRGKYLAIPKTQEAYKQWPRNWQGDRLFRPRGKKYLATSDGQTLTVQYILVDGVHHDPDPRVLIDLEQEANAHLQIATKYLDRQLSR